MSPSAQRGTAIAARSRQERVAGIVYVAHAFEVRKSYSYYHYLKKASQQKPIILSIGWYGQDGRRNGGHWVVCVGPSRDGQWFKVLDPSYGLQYMWTDPKYYLDYWPTRADGRYAAQNGVLDGMIVIGKT